MATTALVAASVTLWAAACGGTAAPSVAVRTLVITGAPDVMAIGEVAQLTATDGGSQQPVQATWTSSVPSVVTVSAGRLVAVGGGFATVQASIVGAIAQTTVQVLPTYAGRYDGEFFVMSCVNASASSPYCDNVLQASQGLTEPIGMTLSQARDSVSGVAGNRQSQGAVSGTVGSDNRLRLNGQLKIVTGGVGAIKQFESWSTYLDPNGKAMFGTFAIRYVSGVDGSLLAVATCELRGLPRTP